MQLNEVTRKAGIEKGREKGKKRGAGNALLSHFPFRFPPSFPSLFLRLPPRLFRRWRGRGVRAQVPQPRYMIVIIITMVLAM